MELGMDETYFTTARPIPRDDQQAPNKRRRGMQVFRRSALHGRSHRPPTRQVNLTGFFCKPGDPEYVEAAKATGTKGNTPVYWFKEYGYENNLFDDVDAVDDIRMMSQAERDAILYSHTVENSMTTPVKTRAGGNRPTSSSRDLMGKGKEKKVQFLEQAVEDANGHRLSKPTEKRNEREEAQAEADLDQDWRWLRDTLGEM